MTISLTSKGVGKKPKRKRIPKTVSLNGPEEIALLNRAGERVKQLVPEITDSEIFRLGLYLLTRAPFDIIRGTIPLLTRSVAGRPPLIRYHDKVFEEDWFALLGDPEKQQTRLALLSELDLLRMDTGNEYTNKRIIEICNELGIEIKE